MSQPALLLLPGLTCDGTVWARQIAELSASADCVVPDYGVVDSIPAMAQAVLCAAPSRFALAGHSMGGRVALEVLRRAPQRVTRLALLDTGYQARPVGRAGENEAERRQRLVDIAYSRGMRAMGQEWVTGMVHPERLHDADLIEGILAMIDSCPLATHSAQIRALLSRPDASDVLLTINCPTLVLCGRQDAWSPLAQHQEIAALIHGSRLETIEDCGHMSTMERPEQVSTALRRWLYE